MKKAKFKIGQRWYYGIKEKDGSGLYAPCLIYKTRPLMIQTFSILGGMSAPFKASKRMLWRFN